MLPSRMCLQKKVQHITLYMLTTGEIVFPEYTHTHTLVVSTYLMRTDTAALVSSPKGPELRTWLLLGAIRSQ